jgi:intracellular sulfur oxidation DsrE/DsrF family protein
MRKKLLLAGMLITASLLLHAQAPPTDYKVVFDMSSGDTVNQKAVVREINLITGYRPDAKLEVTIYGEALAMVLKDKSKVAAGIEDIINNKKGTFKVCAMTMKRQNVDASQLIPGIEVVPDGIFEIYTKQKEGWGYIKVGH